MQDIRKPYTRSKSNHTLADKVEAFENHSYQDEEEEIHQPVHIPVRRSFKERRSIDSMEMFPARGRRAYDNTATAAGTPLEERRSEGDVVYKEPRTRYEKRGQSTGTLAFIAVLLVIIIGGSLLTFVFNSATVTIVPKHEDLTDLRKAITFALPGSDNESTVLYTVATTTLTKSKTLPLSETKKVETKASGKVVIYNNYSTEPQRLIKNTRFESTSGKIYRINESVTVPGKSGSTPGSIEVTVYADSFGSEYNSVPTDFTIPGFRGSAQYTAFYARSNGALSGGASGEQSLASIADINAAKDALALQLAEEMRDKLKNEKLDGYIGLYSAVDVTYADNEQELLSGATATYEVVATGYLPFAKADELAASVAQTTRDYKNEPVRIDNTEAITYTRKTTDRLATVQSLEMLAEGSPRIVYATDESALQTLVAGKKRSEFTSLMKSIASIEGAEISFSPLWLSSFPDDASKIKIVESLPKR